MQSIDSLQQFENLIRCTRIQSRRITVQFSIIKNTMKESLLDISLIDTPTISSCKKKKNAIVAAGEDGKIVSTQNNLCSNVDGVHPQRNVLTATVSRDRFKTRVSQEALNFFLHR
jgi:hypothetical protein